MSPKLSRLKVEDLTTTNKRWRAVCVSPTGLSIGRARGAAGRDRHPENSSRSPPELDPEGLAQFGLVGEEMEKVNPDLVARDEEGKAYTVRYEAVNAMLLNEFLKEHRKVEEQEKIIGELKATTAKQTAILARQEKAIATLTSQVQKVSARVEAQRAAPRLASE
jgi:uncharacterized coiled-coil protein SlyX